MVPLEKAPVEFTAARVEEPAAPGPSKKAPVMWRKISDLCQKVRFLAVFGGMEAQSAR
jgi:hypothetical protein